MMNEEDKFFLGREVAGLKAVIFYYLRNPEEIKAEDILAIKGLFKQLEDLIESR